jgi:hypothetical protein
VNHVDKTNVVNAKSGIEKVVAKTNDLKRITDNLVKKSQLDDELDWEEYLVRNNSASISNNKPELNFFLF